MLSIAHSATSTPHSTHQVKTEKRGGRVERRLGLDMLVVMGMCVSVTMVMVLVTNMVTMTMLMPSMRLMCSRLTVLGHEALVERRKVGALDETRFRLAAVTAHHRSLCVPDVCGVDAGLGSVLM